MSLFADYNLPFAIAFGLMGLLLVLQLVGMGDYDFDADLDADGVGDPTSAGFGGAILSILGLGKVPLFVWLVVFLLIFAVLGMGIQALAADLTGSALFPWLAALFSAGGAIPATAVVARPIGHLMPKDETSAVGLQSLVGRRGIVTTGTARRGSPARTRVYDRHGQSHHVMMEPHEGTGEVGEGQEVLLVRREGQLFYGQPSAERKLSPTG
ncbi:YqiJ family protein [Paraurantiacibacter namhicola]|uniref:Inner membrane protein YqiJ n=1 Tax=Paraurantiacibacter namhicola TaxID=645517 RepID=A0A1C7D8B6_9SPHN|nr:YqiJ family protein [Paraurantiacibacter namhicola]ANU07687.1 Inner membrane protein YqiJ [Paraurantiacibacter namhicola]